MIFQPTKLKNLTLHCSKRLKEARGSSGTSNAMRYSCPAKTPRQKAALSKGGRRPVALSEERSSLTRERQIQAFAYQRCVLHERRDHSHEDHVAD